MEEWIHWEEYVNELSVKISWFSGCIKVSEFFFYYFVFELGF